MSSGVDIRPAIALELDAARSWLADAGLPVADLTADHMQNFLVAEAHGVPIGMIGLERFADVGLLRSLVVDASSRSAGTGALLVAALEARASELGVTELWLLTTDADRYFSRLAYEVIDRSDAADSIQNTKEFLSLCPGDAVLMRKQL